MCAASAIATGHRYQVYTYHPELIAGQLPGCEVVDARTIIPEDSVAYRTVLPVAKPYFADIFRLELLARGCGVWVDFDVLMLKPMRSLNLPASVGIFGFERPDLLGNSVLYIPRDTPMLTEALKISYSFSKIAPWWPLHKKVKRYFRYTTADIAARLRGRPKPVHIKAFMGPHVVTYLAKKYGLIGHAQPMPVFYPVPQTENRKFADADSSLVRSQLRPETVGIHLCHGSFVGGPFLLSVPKSGYLAEMCASLGITDTVATQAQMVAG
jgi:hypothetical protein